MADFLRVCAVIGAVLSMLNKIATLTKTCLEIRPPWKDRRNHHQAGCATALGEAERRH